MVKINSVFNHLTMLDPTRGGLRPNGTEKSCNRLHLQPSNRKTTLFFHNRRSCNIQLRKLLRLIRHDHGYEIETGSNFETERLVRTVITGNPGFHAMQPRFPQQNTVAEREGDGGCDHGVALSQEASGNGHAHPLHEEQDGADVREHHSVLHGGHREPLNGRCGK